MTYSSYLNDSIQTLLKIVEKTIPKEPSGDQLEGGGTPIDDIEFKDILIYTHIVDCRSIFKEIFLLFNSSLLSGEYIFNEQIHDQLKGFNEEFLKILSISETPLELYDELLKASRIFQFITNLYDGFILEIKCFYDIEDNDYMVYRLEEGQYTLSSIDNEFPYNLYRQIFNANLNLSYCDHFGSSSTDYLQKLIQIHRLLVLEELADCETPELIEILTNKVNFLISKWALRYQELGYKQNFIFVDGSSSIDLKDKKPSNLNLKNWLEYSSNHYIKYESIFRRDTVKLINNNNEPYDIETLTFYNYHRLIKYFKDEVKNETELKRIVEVIKCKSSSESVNFFDKYALAVLKNYSRNNLFSILIGKCKNIDDAITIFNEFKSNENEINNNYFLYFKFLKVALVLFEEKLKKEEDLVKDLTINKKNLEIFDNAVSEYEKRLNHVRNKANFIFLKPFDESSIMLDYSYQFGKHSLEKIFIASSFVIPTPLQERQNDFNIIKSKVEQLKQNLLLLELIKSPLNEVNQIKDDLKRTEQRNIEIIGVFTAVVTFVLSGVQGYKFVDNLWEHVYFSLSLAAALFLFVTLLLFSSRGLSSKVRNYTYGTIAFSLVIIHLLLLFFYSDQKAIVEKQIDKKFDSIYPKHERNQDYLKNRPIQPSK